MIIISEQITLLLKSIGECLSLNSKNLPTQFVFSASLNWNKIYEMAGYHGLRPILYESLKNINIPISAKLEAHARENVVSNMVSSNEFVRVIGLCTSNNINFIPYKGHSFLASIYQRKQLREIGDLDFLFHPSDAKKRSRAIS